MFGKSRAIMNRQATKNRSTNQKTLTLDRYNLSVHDNVYFVEIHQLFAELLAKKRHTGNGELAVVHASSLSTRFV